MNGPEDHSVITEGYWWMPGDGEPGESWIATGSDVKLQLFPGEKEIDVLIPTVDGDRALVAIPVEAVALLLIRERLSGGSDER